MKDFVEYTPKEEQIEVKTEITGRDIPIEPHLMGYIFKNILGFNVRYRIFEKINYIINFKYKNTIGQVCHYKLSYRLFIDRAVEIEIVNLLKKVYKLMECALMEYSKKAIDENKFSLLNYYSMYDEKIKLLSKNIEKVKKRIKNTVKLFEKKKQELIDKGMAYKEEYVDSGSQGYKVVETPLSRLTKKYYHKERENNLEMSYTIEVYVDTWFSFIEHICSLLYPMTESFNFEEKYIKYLNSDWRAKINKILRDNLKDEISAISKIKEVYRNRFTHGMFSREKEVHVQIENLGMYPLWVGQKYCRGFQGASHHIGYKEYKEIKKLFNDLYIGLVNEYELQMNVIQAKIPTFLNHKFYEQAFKSDVDNTNWIAKYWYEQNNLLNMEW